MGYKVKRILKWVKKNRGLPSAYQEVEWIQSSGTQYIETGVAGSMNMTTELKLNSQYIGESAIFGSAWSLNGNFLMFYNNAIRWHSSTAVDVACSLNTDYTIATENGKVTINGTSYTNTASSSVSTNNVKLFECATGPMGQFKLYYFKIRKGGTLVRDFVPCYRKSDSVIGLYDLVNDTFYTNSGSGTFTKGNDVPDMVEKQVRPKRLPSTYQEVEWIQSSGSQYIDTGVTAPTNYLQTYMKINPQTVSSSSADYRAGGAYNGSRANVHYIGYGQGRFYAGFGGGDYNTGISISANSLYEITMTANSGSYSVTVNNSTVTGTYSGSVALNRTFFLFRNNENGSAGAGGTFKIYSFQMTTSGGLVRDFVPCYRKSDSVIGMYDLVNDTFYTNSGSGTFTKGPDIN